MAETSQIAIAISTQPLNAEEIVQEVLAIERECAEALLEIADKLPGLGWPRN